MPKVADFIEQNREWIVERFAEEAGKLESARGVKPYELIDTLHEYLGTLVAISRQGHRGDKARTKQRLEESHLSLRLRLGYNQEEVTNEYVMLGRIISSLWEHLPIEQRPSPEDTALFFEDLQGAMDNTIAIFSGYSLEDRQREKRALRRLDALGPEVLKRDEPGALRQALVPLLEVIQEALAADGTELLLVDSSRKWLEPAAVSGACPPFPPGYRAPLDGASFVARVAGSEEPVHLPDAATSSLEVREEVRGSGLRSLLGLRLWPHGEVMGVLWVGVRQMRSFEPQARRYMETLVEYLSGILDRALLFEALREANRRLRQERELLSAVLERMPAAVFIAEAPSGRLVFGNQQVAKVLGHSFHASSDVSGYAQYQAVHPDGRPYAPDEYPLARAIQKGESVERAEVRYRRGDGTLGFFNVSAVPIRDAEGRIISGVATIADLTEQKRAEEDMRRTAEFAEQLMGIVSHDLRNPLNAIGLSVAALLRHENLDERQAKGLARITASAERANRMIRDLLDFTRARLGGGIPIERAPFDFHLVVQQAVEEVRLAHPEREISLARGGPGETEGDGDRLAQVVTNLVVNALTYSPVGTPVRVETRGEEDGVVLRINNQGEPIPQELIPRLFEPMTRGGHRRDAASRSIGLGLYIVDNIVRAHCGTIEVRSTAEEGTTFTVRLPRRC
ncbi:sensor histidine kinase [Archangium lipolyticum]|uniref:sensor histidine kinase n=1 Tax=Archangium lipolyticum TaxID=2970465 RepID=UPI002149A602|nr:ATP-binding protein [Archangium lipolyticum]